MSTEKPYGSALREALRDIKISDAQVFERLRMLAAEAGLTRSLMARLILIDGIKAIEGAQVQAAAQRYKERLPYIGNDRRTSYKGTHEAR